MSCLPSSQKLMSDSSSDYGSDFSPDEEELINELLAKAVAEHATTGTTATAASPTTPEPPSQAEILAAVGDIEDYYEGVLPGPLTPRVLGRQKPAWQVSRVRHGAVPSRANGTPGNDGTATGMSTLLCCYCVSCSLLFAVIVLCCRARGRLVSTS